MENPSYWSITPAFVRYSEDLTLLQRYLYSEITSLTNKEGYCWASNAYFARLYKKNPNYISNCLNDMAKKGYIRIEITQDKGNYRKIWIAIQKNLNTYSEKPEEGSTEKPEHNNININNKKNNKSNRENAFEITEKKFSKKTDMTTEVFTDLAGKYNCPVSFVENCWDSACNWMEANGKTKKNYKAFLDNWVKAEVIKFKLNLQKGKTNGIRIARFEPTRSN